MEVRQARTGDRASFCILKNAFLMEYGISTKDERFVAKEFRAHLRQNIFLIATRKKQMIGYLVATVEKGRYETAGYIEEVFVMRPYRNQKVASRLKAKLFRVLRQRRVGLCRLDVKPNTQPKRVYEKWGFKVDKLRMVVRL